MTSTAQESLAGEENALDSNLREEVKLHRLDPRRKSLLIATGLLTALICTIALAVIQAGQSNSTAETMLKAVSLLALAGTTIIIVKTSISITRLEFWIRRMGAGDLEHNIRPQGHDEFTEITYDLEVLRQRSIRSEQLDLVRGLSEELEDKNQALEKTLNELHTTQDQVVSRQKLAEIGELAAGIAHEVRNPLNIISNFAGSSRELMEELTEELMEAPAEENGEGKSQGAAGGQDPGERDETVREILGELRENMGRIESNCSRASSIIQEVTNMSRSNTGQQRPVEINRLVHDYTMLAYQATRSQYRDFNVKIVEDMDPEAGEAVCVPEELSRVFINVASNACYATRKRMSEGEEQGYEPTMWVSTKRVDGTIEIAVRDNGTGIPPELVNRIFNPFVTTKPTNEGTGLGLSLSHEIIRKHGGKIAVESELGEYTEMRITLPVQPVEEMAGTTAG